MKLWKARAAGSLGGVIVGGLMVLAMTSCDSQAGAASTEAEIYKRSDQLYVTHDPVNSVTCWTRYGTTSNLSCLPDWMLTPAQRKPLAAECLVKDVGVSEACRLLLDPPPAS